MVVVVLVIKRLDGIWGPIRPTRSLKDPSTRTNRRGVLVNASKLLCNIAGLSLSIGDMQPVGHLFTLNFNIFEIINMEICNCCSYHI
jgi:hypothetical protein